MPTLYNHSHEFYAHRYIEHNPTRYIEMRTNGGMHGGRVIPCTEPGDTLQLDPRLGETWRFMQDHLGGLGVATATEIIWDTDPDIANDFPDYELSMFGFDRDAHRLRPDRRRMDASDLANNKNSFIDYCVRAGHPVPDTVIVNNGSVPDYDGLSMPVYVKAARSSTGTSVYKCETPDQVKASIEGIGSEYQIQAEAVDTQAFVGIQYRGLGRKAVHLATSEQILDGFSSVGSKHPSSFDPRHVTDQLANEMAVLGLKDIFGFDVAITPVGPKILECNARWNGSSYPAILASRLGVTEWTTHTMDTSLTRPGDIKLGSRAYNNSRGYGAIVINTSHMRSHGKVGVMLVGPAAAQQELQGRLAATL